MESRASVAHQVDLPLGIIPSSREKLDWALSSPLEWPFFFSSPLCLLTSRHGDAERNSLYRAGWKNLDQESRLLYRSMAKSSLTSKAWVTRGGKKNKKKTIAASSSGDALSARSSCISKDIFQGAVEITRDGHHDQHHHRHLGLLCCVRWVCDQCRHFPWARERERKERTKTKTKTRRMS